VGRGGGAAAGGGGGGAGRGGGAAAGGGGGGAAGRGGAAAGGAAGPFGAPAGGGASFLAPGGPPSSLACATTSGAVCACDAEVASCVAVKAVVASSRMRSFVMIFLVPGIGLTAANGPHWHVSWSIERLIIRPDCGDLQMVGWFLFHWRNGLHASLFIARSGGAFMCPPDRWRDLGSWGCLARASVTHPASYPATPAVVMAHPVHGLGVESPDWDCPEDSPAAVQSAVLASPAVSPAVQ
jgi:hypothetical protein